MSSAALNLLECINIGDDEIHEFRLISDFGINCRSLNYYTWVMVGALPLLIIIGFGFPILIYLILWKKKKSNSLLERTNLYLYGFFYLAY